jgi:hypothetical protein
MDPRVESTGSDPILSFSAEMEYCRTWIGRREHFVDGWRISY